MTQTHSERIGLFIDGSNFHSTAKLLNLEVDYLKLLNFFKRKGQMIRAYYYTALPEQSEISPLRKLTDFLDYNGYTIVSKQTKEYTDHMSGERRVKGNMDMELALDMLKMSKHLDHVYLFSGDGDFCRLLEDVQDRGVRVTVVSSTHTQPKLIADSLRRKADAFIDIEDIYEDLSRN